MQVGHWHLLHIIILDDSRRDISFKYISIQFDSEEKRSVLQISVLNIALQPLTFRTLHADLVLVRIYSDQIDGAC